MKVGDVVKFRDGVPYGADVEVGIVIEKTHYTVPDGSPSGDFTRHAMWRALFGDRVLTIKNRRNIEVISESR